MYKKKFVALLEECLIENELFILKIASARSEFAGNIPDVVFPPFFLVFY